MTVDLEFILTVVSSVVASGSAAAGINAWASRRKVAAAIDVDLSTEARALLAAARDELRRVRQERDGLQERVEELDTRLSRTEAHHAECQARLAGAMVRIEHLEARLSEIES